MQVLLLLDLDGTLIDTPHFEAWRQAARRMGVADITRQEYVAHIAGRPRLEGASRLLELKGGDKGEARRLYDGNSLAQIKQREFLRLASQTRLFDDASRLLERVLMSRQPVKFYTASENAPQLFDAAWRHPEKKRIWECVIQQGCGQPREELFSSLAYGHPPQAVTLVDDSPHAIDAACRLGMQGIQIRRGGYEPVATDPRARTVPSLDDLRVPTCHSQRNMK